MGWRSGRLGIDEMEKKVRLKVIRDTISVMP